MKQFLCLFLLTLIFNSCKKDDDITPSNDESDFLQPEEVLFLDNKEASTIELQDVLLPNGFYVDEYLELQDSSFYQAWVRSGDDCDNPVKCKNILISKMTAIGLNLTNRSLYQYPEEGANKPAQNGLAYSYGSKNYSVRQRPSGACPEEVYGLDCSGFIYQLFSQSGVNLPKGPADKQRKENVIKDALISCFPNWQNIKVEDLGEIVPEEMESGDLIYWKRNNGTAFHNGIILKSGTEELAVFQSNGTPGSDSNFDAEDCMKNYGLNRGPRVLKLGDPYWFAKDYSVVRIISKNWDLDLFFPSLASHMVEDSRANKWIGTPDGLYKYNGGEWTIYNTSNSALPDNFITALDIDNSDNLWIGTLSGGIALFNNNNFQVYNTDNTDIPHNTINTITVNQGVVWAGFSAKGLAYLNGNSWERIKWATGGYTYSPKTIAFQGTNVWIGEVSDGIGRYDGNEWELFNPSNSDLPDDHITDVSVDANNNVWVTTLEGGFVKIANGGEWEVFNSMNTPIPGNHSNVVEFDPEGNAWIGYIGAAPDFSALGLTKVTPSGEITYYAGMDYPFGNINSIVIDKSGNKWMSMSFGIGVLYSD